MKAESAYGKLRRLYPGAQISLEFSNTLELLIAVILSAQCTDERVNKVTRTLFKRYRTAAEYAAADMGELKTIIRPSGFYNSKAKYIMGSCKIIAQTHGGRVPRTMEELTALPGVARKTANIVLSNGFGVNEGIAVDTHMIRLNNRLGLVNGRDPIKIERELMEQLPKELWNKYTYVIIEHGRAICKAPTPSCSRCALEQDCPKIGVAKTK